MATLLRANGIPATDGQGGWVGNDGEIWGNHVKGVAFLQKVGWVSFGVSPDVSDPVGPFRLGARSGDNYLAEWAKDLPALYRIPDPPGATKETKVLHGRINGGDWWRSWAINQGG
jgi:hypothetical protein